MLSPESLPSKQSMKWFTKETPYKWCLFTEELWVSRSPENRREMARDSKPSLQHFEVKASAVGWEFVSAGWVSSESWLHPSLPQPQDKTNENASRGLSGQAPTFVGHIQQISHKFSFWFWMYYLLRYMWELLSLGKKCAVLPHCVVGTMMIAAWGEKGSAVLPAAGLLPGFWLLGWRRTVFDATVSLNSFFWVVLSLSVDVNSQKRSCSALEHHILHWRTSKDLSLLDGTDWSSMGFLPALQLEHRKLRLWHFLRVI